MDIRRTGTRRNGRAGRARIGVASVVCGRGSVRVWECAAVGVCGLGVCGLRVCGFGSVWVWECVAAHAASRGAYSPTITQHSYRNHAALTSHSRSTHIALTSHARSTHVARTQHSRRTHIALTSHARSTHRGVLASPQALLLHHDFHLTGSPQPGAEPALVKVVRRLSRIALRASRGARGANPTSSLATRPPRPTYLPRSDRHPEWTCPTCPHLLCGCRPLGLLTLAAAARGHGALPCSAPAAAIATN